MTPRTIARRGALLLAGAAAALVVTHATPEPSPVLPGPATLQVWEDGSFAATGCIPHKPCALPKIDTLED